MMILSPALRLAQLQAIATALDAGTGGGFVRLYANARVAIHLMPAQADLLCELTLPKPCIEHIDSDVLRLKPPADRLCIRTGTAIWARLLDGDGRTVLDLDVGLIDSDADIELDKVLLLAGGVVRLPELAFYAPIE
jgi:hypothetical protein